MGSRTHVARLQDDTGLTGVVAAVMTNGRLVGAAASGERRRGSGIPVTVDDRWHVGSIHQVDDGHAARRAGRRRTALGRRHGGGVAAGSRNERRLGRLHAAPSADAHRGRPGELSAQGAERLARDTRGTSRGATPVSSPTFSPGSPSRPAASASPIPTSATRSPAILPRRLPARPTNRCCASACSHRSASPAPGSVRRKAMPRTRSRSGIASCCAGFDCAWTRSRRAPTTRR